MTYGNITVKSCMHIVIIGSQKSWPTLTHKPILQQLNWSCLQDGVQKRLLLHTTDCTTRFSYTHIRFVVVEQVEEVRPCSRLKTFFIDVRKQPGVKNVQGANEGARCQPRVRGEEKKGVTLCGEENVMET